MTILYRKLDASGDYVFGSNGNDFYSGTEAVAQAIYTTLQLYQGQWWEDTSVGVPMFQSILGQSGTPEHLRGVDMLIQEAILNVQGVSEIISFESSYDSVSRTYSITSCNVQTQFGQLDVLYVLGWKQSNGQYILTLFPVIYQMK